MCKNNFLFQLQWSHASLPKFVHRVSKCPEPKNITEWEQASAILGCLHPIRGGTSKQLDRVYHCIPTSPLSEVVEYCGIVTRASKGIILHLYLEITYCKNLDFAVNDRISLFIIFISLCLIKVLILALCHCLITFRTLPTMQQI
jgi:hypothetical protein